MPVSYFHFKYGFGIIGLLKWVSQTLKSRLQVCRADVAQSAEHPPCKRAVTSSILVVGSTRLIADFLKVISK